MCDMNIMLQDVAWVPCWLQNLRTNGFNEYVKESQGPSNQAEKDLTPSQENGIDVEDFNVLSREEGGYKSCHLLLSGDDSSSLSVAPSPGNVFQFRLHLSSDVDSFFCSTHDFNQFHHSVAPCKALSLQPSQSSVDFRENMHSIMDHHACEQDVLADFIPDTTKKDAVTSPIDTFDSVRQEKEKSKIKGCKNADISDAVELSIAASEALVIHDLVKMESVSETLRTEDVLEVALRVKQARLEGMEDGLHFSSEESDCSDSLSDLNDSLMGDAYEDIGLFIGASFDENLCNSAIFFKGASSAENYNGCNNKHSDREFTSQLANFDDNSQQKHLEVHMEMQIQQNPYLPLDPVCNSKHSDKEFASLLANFDDNSEQKQLEVNMEIEIQQNSDLPLDPVCGESEMHPDDPDLGANTSNHFANDLPISHQHRENNTNVSALPQTDGLAMADLISVKPQNNVSSSLVETSGNFKNENLVAYLAPERFRSRWFGGWTCKESHMSSLNRNNAERIPMCVVRETSFITESVDVPDVSSCVLKHDPKCAINSQLSMSCEGLPKTTDESVLHSQDVVRCSSLSSIDPLCSVVPCSIASEHDDYKTHIDKENDTEYFVPSVSDFEVDNFQRISDKNATFDCRDEKIVSVLDEKDIPATATEMVEQMCEKLTRVEHTCLRAYSMILPNQAVMTNCNLTPFPTNQSIGGADASLGTRVSESLSTSKHVAGNKNEVNCQYLIGQKSITEIRDDKSDELKAAELTQERRSPRILNLSRRRHLLDPKVAVNDIGIEKNLKHDVVPETSYQHQLNNNLNKLQVECNGGDVRVKKRVHFSEKVAEHQLERKSPRLESSRKRCSSIRPKRQRVSKSLTTSVPRLKHSLTKYCRSAVSEFIFRGIVFLLTGLSSQQERDLEAHIRNSGGVILSDIPSPNSKGKRSSTLSCMQLPIILCKRKLQTTKFLYGCAVGALILKVDWLTDCLASGNILQPEKYMILPNRNDMKWTRIGKEIHHRIRKHIFDRVGIMLHGKHSFCTKFACIIKHGGGQVFKTLQWLVRSTDEGRNLVGTIVVEDMITISRHLKSCALEWDIPIMPSSWIIKSLYSGKLLPFAEENNSFSLPFAEIPEVQGSMDMSEEI